MTDAGAGSRLPRWTWAAPLVAALLLAAVGRHLVSAGGGFFLLAAPVVLVTAVFAAVTHAETVSQRLGATLGAIVLALAVTAIEVSLIAALMLHAAAEATTVARDTVFAGVMVVLNGVVGTALLVGGLRHREQHFQLQGTASALGVLGTLAIITMVLPDYTVTDPGRFFTPLQLAFVSAASLLLYGVYIGVQATSQRSYFTSAEPEAAPHAPVPGWVVLRAIGLLVVTLAAIVLLADALSPQVQRVVLGAGLPLEFVAVIVAAIVLLPEATSAVKAARGGPGADQPQLRARLGDRLDRTDDTGDRAAFGGARRADRARTGAGARGAADADAVRLDAEPLDRADHRPAGGDPPGDLRRLPGDRGGALRKASRAQGAAL